MVGHSSKLSLILIAVVLSAIISIWLYNGKIPMVFSPAPSINGPDFISLSEVTTKRTSDSSNMDGVGRFITAQVLQESNKPSVGPNTFFTFSYWFGELVGESQWKETGHATVKSKNILSHVWFPWTSGGPSNPVDPVAVVEPPLISPSSSQPSVPQQVVTTDPMAMQALTTEPLFTDPALTTQQTLLAPPLTALSLQPLAIDPASATGQPSDTADKELSTSSTPEGEISRENTNTDVTDPTARSSDGSLTEQTADNNAVQTQTIKKDSVGEDIQNTETPTSASDNTMTANNAGDRSTDPDHDSDTDTDTKEEDTDHDSDTDTDTKDCTDSNNEEVEE
jgi:hypothetical protein